MTSTPPTSSETNELVHCGWSIGDKVQFYRQTTLAKGVITGYASADFAHVRLETDEEHFASYQQARKA